MTDKPINNLFIGTKPEAPVNPCEGCDEQFPNCKNECFAGIHYKGELAMYQSFKLQPVTAEQIERLAISIVIDLKGAKSITEQKSIIHEWMQKLQEIKQ